MKRMILALAAVASIAGPMAVATEAAAQGRGPDRWDRRDDRRDNRWDDRRDNRRDDRRDSRWDDRRYNGYYYNNRWSYGPPPAAYYGRPGFRPGYQQWRRGAYLPPSYRSYPVYDYGRYRLRPPPRGYQWMNVNGDYVLAALATGLILDVIINGR